MKDMDNGKISKRVFFPSGRQKIFLETVQKKTGFSWKKLAQKVNIHNRTLNDWRREKYSIPLVAVRKLALISHIKISKNVTIKEAYSHTSLAGKKAGKLVYEKYGSIGGDPEHRKRQWRKWWNEKGKFNLPHQFQQKDIALPKQSSLLAEFVGAFIGDGGMTKGQITITLNCKDDALYIVFITRIIQKLFDIKPGLFTRTKHSVSIITISRIRAVAFLQSMGFKTGNKIKYGIDIPQWITRNRTYKIACMRGLMDTDGCIYNECHTAKGKKYCYIRLSLVSASPKLQLSVFKILEGLGFSPKIRNNRSVQLEKHEEIVRYFKIVGSSNSKHKRRFEQFSGGVG